MFLRACNRNLKEEKTTAVNQYYKFVSMFCYIKNTRLKWQSASNLPTSFVSFIYVWSICFLNRSPYVITPFAVLHVKLNN